MGSLLRNFGWNTLNQVVTAISSLVIVPIALHRLGVAPYGVFTLAIAAVGLLQQLDGGLLSSALRYFGIAVGAEDRRTLTRQFISMVYVVLSISCLVGAAVFHWARPIAQIFDIPRDLQPDATFATRLVAVLLPLGMLQGILQAMAQAHGAYRLVATTGTVFRVGFVAAAIIWVHRDGGLHTILWLTLFQQIAITLAIAPAALRRLSRREFGFLSRTEFRELVTYSARVQLYTVANVINLQADTLIIAGFLPPRDVALYGTGATIAAQLRSLASNAATPLVTRLSQLIGAEGEARAFREFARVQAIWCVVVGGGCALAIGAAVFQVQAWLGASFRGAGIVCVILTAGNLINLLTAPLTVYLQAIGRPEVEVRYGIFGAVLNLVLTFGLIWLGLYAIVAATAGAQIVSSVGLLWLARRAITPDLPSFLTPVPWPAVTVTALVTGAAAWGLYLITPVHGVLGLAFVSISALAGLLVYLALTQTLRSPSRSRSDGGPERRSR